MPGVAVQMFSLREVARADYGAALRLVVEAGYDAIENAFGYGGLSASQVAPLLADLGIRVASSHISLSRLADALDDEIDFHLAIGCDHLLAAELPRADRADEAALHRWAETFNRIGRRCRERGARFSYHSHAFELRRFGSRRGLEILLDETDPTLVGWEPDVYWLTYGGVDPVEWIGRYAGRSHLLHLKDMRHGPLPPDPIEANTADLAAYASAALGEGTIDVGPAIAAATAAEWLIVEQDFALGPMLEALASSRRYLRARGY